MTVIDALDKVIVYLEDEREDYENRPAAERQNHIWTAVQVLMRHRAELAADD